MPKVKTHKGASKRLKLTKTGKLMTRAAGQDHFNSRDRSNTTTKKRTDITLSKVSNKLKLLIPYK